MLSLCGYFCFVQVSLGQLGKSTSGVQKRRRHSDTSARTERAELEDALPWGLTVTGSPAPVKSDRKSSSSAVMNAPKMDIPAEAQKISLKSAAGTFSASGRSLSAHSSSSTRPPPVVDVTLDDEYDPAVEIEYCPNEPTVRMNQSRPFPTEASSMTMPARHQKSKATSGTTCRTGTFLEFCSLERLLAHLSGAVKDIEEYFEEREADNTDNSGAKKFIKALKVSKNLK